MNPESTADIASPPPQIQPKTNRSVVALGVFLVLIPLALLCVLINRHWVSVPLLDDWEMAPLIVKSRTGGLSFADIFVQHAEARNSIPKLLFIAFSVGDRWDVRVPMAVGVVFCCLTVWLLYVLLRKSGLAQWTSTVAIFLMALLVFSLSQHELWLLASGFYSFLPVLCVVAALVILQTKLSVGAKFLLCGLLSFISSFTLAHGLLAWALTFPMLFLQGRPARWVSWLAAWIALTAGCVALYSYGYRQPSDLPPFAPAISLVDYVRYLLAYLGAVFGRSGTDSPLLVSQIVGAMLLLLFTGLVGYVVRFRGDEQLRRAAVPWFAVGLYAIGSGCLAALGRIAWGVPQSLESRYVAFSLYLCVAIIALVPIIASHVSKTRGSRSLSLPLRAAIGVLALSLIALHVVCSAASVDWFRKRSAATRLGHGATLFSQVLDTSQTIKQVMYPRPGFLRVHADALDRLHLLKPPLIRTAKVKEIRRGTADGKVLTGWLDGIADVGPDRVAAWGWTALHTRGRPADCVLLAYDTPDGEVLFAISDAIEHRGDVMNSLGDRDYELSGWRATFPRSSVPAGATLSAWAVDAKDAKLYRLQTTMPDPKL